MSRQSAQKLLIACGLLLTSCATASAQWSRPPSVLSQPGANDKLFPLDAPFRLAAINGKPVHGDQNFTIDSSFRGSGFGGCNTWSAALYPIRGQRLAMGPVALTRKVCAPALMAEERAFLFMLHSGPTWTIDGPILTVKSRGGTLRFQRGY